MLENLEDDFDSVHPEMASFISILHSLRTFYFDPDETHGLRLRRSVRSGIYGLVLEHNLLFVGEPM